MNVIFDVAPIGVALPYIIISLIALGILIVLGVSMYFVIKGIKKSKDNKNTINSENKEDKIDKEIK